MLQKVRPNWVRLAAGEFPESESQVSKVRFAMSSSFGAREIDRGYRALIRCERVHAAKIISRLEHTMISEYVPEPLQDGAPPLRLLLSAHHPWCPRPH